MMKMFFANTLQHIAWLFFAQECDCDSGLNLNGLCRAWPDKTDYDGGKLSVRFWIGDKLNNFASLFADWQ